MRLIDKFPTTGWKNQKLKEVVQILLEMEQDFEIRKAPSTLGSILLTLGNVYKDDAGQISLLLTHPVPNTKRLAVKVFDPNPASLSQFEPDCPTCPGAKKVVLRTASVQPMQDTPVNTGDPNQTELDTTLAQVVGTETIIVSEEHAKPRFASAEEVWKFFSGDLKKLQDAAEIAGIRNAKYDQVPMSLAKKIYNAQ